MIQKCLWKLNWFKLLHRHRFFFSHQTIRLQNWRWKIVTHFTLHHVQFQNFFSQIIRWIFIIWKNWSRMVKNLLLDYIINIYSNIHIRKAQRNCELAVQAHSQTLAIFIQRIIDFFLVRISMEFRSNADYSIEQ